MFKNSKNQLKNSILYLDNYSAHKTRLVKSVIQKLSLNVIFSASHSCDLNPIELFFNSLKYSIFQ